MGYDVNHESMQCKRIRVHYIFRHFCVTLHNDCSLFWRKGILP